MEYIAHYMKAKTRYEEREREREAFNNKSLN